MAEPTSKKGAKGPAVEDLQEALSGARMLAHHQSRIPGDTD
jgi:hypothetical protein